MDVAAWLQGLGLERYVPCTDSEAVREAAFGLALTRPSGQLSGAWEEAPVRRWREPNSNSRSHVARVPQN